MSKEHYEKYKVGEPDPDYGGIVTDVSTLPIGTTFFVCNGCWYGRIIVRGGQKIIQCWDMNALVGRDRTMDTVKPKNEALMTVDTNNLLSLSDICYPEKADPSKKKEPAKTITLDNGKYTIVYDETNRYPVECLRYGQPWRDLKGDNLIFFLCAALEERGGCD